jgi:hypothetical protein
MATEAAIPKPKVRQVERIVTAEWRFEIGPSYSNPPLPDAVHDYFCKLWGEAQLPGGNGCAVKIVLKANGRET